MLAPRGRACARYAVPVHTLPGTPVPTTPRTRRHTHTRTHTTHTHTRTHTTVDTQRSHTHDTHTSAERCVCRVQQASSCAAGDTHERFTGKKGKVDSRLPRGFASRALWRLDTHIFQDKKRVGAVLSDTLGWKHRARLLLPAAQSSAGPPMLRSPRTGAWGAKTSYPRYARYARPRARGRRAHSRALTQSSSWRQL